MKGDASTASKKSIESELTTYFTKKAIEEIIAEPNDTTRDYIDNLKKEIRRAIAQFFTTTRNCPEKIVITEFRKSVIENRIVITILVHGKKDGSQYTHKQVCSWLGVRFLDNVESIFAYNDAKIEIVRTHKIFNATGDILKTHLFPEK